jgi:hypothetical protein
MQNSITWKKLVEEEPQLQNLLDEIRKIKDPGGEFFCAREVWFEGYQ